MEITFGNLIDPKTSRFLVPEELSITAGDLSTSAENLSISDSATGTSKEFPTGDESKLICKI